MNSQTMLEVERPNTIEKIAEESPFLVEYFMVQGLCFRGMAYCDDKGSWRSAYSNSQLMGRIYLLE